MGGEDKKMRGLQKRGKALIGCHQATKLQEKSFANSNRFDRIR